MTFKEFVQLSQMNFGMSADFLEYYAKKYPEPPENPHHSDLPTILTSLREGERLCGQVLKCFNKKEIEEDYQI